MVIFGAGASYDSVYPDDLLTQPEKFAVGGSSTVPPTHPAYPDRLPLANGLAGLRDRFGHAMDLFPQVRPLLMHLRRRMAETSNQLDIEQELETILSRGEQLPQYLRQLAAFRFYIREIIETTTVDWMSLAHGATNYVTLLDRIEEWRSWRNDTACFVTFNYDLLLDQAVSDVLGHYIGTIDDYIGPIDWKAPLFKLHGSVNWGRFVGQSDRLHEGAPISMESQLINEAPHMVPLDEYMKVPTRGLLVAYHGRPMLPAIAIPTRSKADFECPAAHRERLTTLIPEIDRLLIVGWRATEQHFLRLWQGQTHPDLRAWVVNENQEAAQRAAVEFANGTGLALNRIRGANVQGFSRLVNRDQADEGEGVLRQLLA